MPTWAALGPAWVGVFCLCGASKEKYQDVSGDPVVVFQTTLVTMELLDSTGSTELNGGAHYYASGWKTFGGGTTTTQVDGPDRRLVEGCLGRDSGWRSNPLHGDSAPAETVERGWLRQEQALWVGNLIGTASYRSG